MRACQRGEDAVRSSSGRLSPSHRAASVHTPVMKWSTGSRHRHTRAHKLLSSWPPATSRQAQITYRQADGIRI